MKNLSLDIHAVFADYFKGCEALAYALSSKLQDGNMSIRIEDYANQAAGFEDNPYFTQVEEFVKQTQEGPYVTHSSQDGETEELKPFVVLNSMAYLQRYFRYESEIIANIQRLGDKFHIITGGPGTGKTFSITELLVGMVGKNPDLKIALAAPTGKAAARMNESIKQNVVNRSDLKENVREVLTQLQAKTLHRLLGSLPNTVFFKHNAQNRLPYDIVIVDECSMIDGPLMAKLLNAIGDNTLLYLLGDKDQLASVEAGSVFGDICRAQATPLLKERVKVNLKSYRFDDDKGIGKFSRAVIDGNCSLADFKNDEQVTIDTEYSYSLFEEYAIKYKAYIIEPDIKKALTKLNDVRFLCATREHDHSVDEYNQKIERFLRREVEGFSPKRGFYHNQPIIITQNDYTHQIFNGDVAIIRESEKDGRTEMIAHFEDMDGGIKTIPAHYLNHYQTMFAMTIHKSQGSEFTHVMVVLPEKRGRKLLTRELLYTAVTRAKEHVAIMSSPETLALSMEKSVNRASGITPRLNNLKA